MKSRIGVLWLWTLPLGAIGAPCAAAPICDHHFVDTDLAVGTVTVNRLFANRHEVASSNRLCDEVAEGLEMGLGDPRWEGFAAEWGGLTNMEFLLGPRGDFGDPVLVVQGQFVDYLDEINAAIGGGAIVRLEPINSVGNGVFELYGGVLHDTPGPGDTTVVTGTANNYIYEVNATITVPDDAEIRSPVPEPGTGVLGLLSVAALATYRKRQRQTVGHAD